jgi:NADP-dependent 3-hydroxy acid dehydrogenase YdfG
MMSTSLNGRVAVVTRASGGMGAATAELLAERGAKVALLARCAIRLQPLVERITANGGTALPITVDLGDAASVAAAAAEVRDRLGRVSIVSNNAGVMLPASMEEQRTEEWRRQIDVNIGATLATIDAFIDDLVSSAAEGGPADLVNTSSIAAKYLFPTFAVYSATQAFISHLTQHLRTELGPKNVRISVVEPGLVATEPDTQVEDEGGRRWLTGKDRIEWLRPADIAEIIAFTVALPRRVNLQQVTVMPTWQS